MAETGSAAALALDGGPCAIGLESTVVALLDGPPRLLRPGAVTRAQIEALVGPLAEAEADARRSPGRLARHYAPNAPLRLDADGAAAGRGLPRLRSGAGRAAACSISARAATWPRPRPTCSPSCAPPMRRSPAAIAVAPIPHEGLGEAINDRLARAAGHVG